MSSVDPNGFMSSKLVLSEPYNDPSPARLIEEYQRLDYRIPYQVEHFISMLLEAFMEQHGSQRVRVADLGCSFGFTAMLLQQGMAYREISPEIAKRWSEDVSRAPHAAVGPSGVEVFGTDISENAIEFCQRTGVQRWSWAGDLETEELPSKYAEVAAEVNFIFSSGAYGEITDQSVCRVLQHVRDVNKVWVGNFALTPLSYLTSATALSKYGLVTEASPVLFAHRRFSSDTERKSAIDALDRAGLNSEAEQKYDSLFARFYLSRPAQDADTSLEGFWNEECARHYESVIVPDPERPDFSFTGAARG